MPAARRIAVPLLLSLAALAVRPAGGAEGIALILSESGGAYAEVASALRQELNGLAVVSQALAADPEPLPRVAPRAAVAVGTEACRALARAGVAAQTSLCVLLPRIAYERIAERARTRNRPLAALVLDQPLARQFALMRAALPDRRRIAALLGPESGPLAAALVQGASAQGLRLSHVQVDSDDELAGALQIALGDADVLLAVPDGVVYNGHTIQNILRTAFGRRVPLVAFSPAYVRAGALVAVYSTPAQIGRQAGRSLRAALGGRELPPLQYPQEFEVAVNSHVAHSLGIDLDDAAALAEQLRRSEPGR